MTGYDDDRLGEIAGHPAHDDPVFARALACAGTGIATGHGPLIALAPVVAGATARPWSPRPRRPRGPDPPHGP